MRIIKILLATLFSIALASCGGGGGGGGAAPSSSAGSIVLATVSPLDNATVGEYFAQNVVQRITPASTYTYSIDTLANGNGVPTGMTLDMNGNLSGTPFATGAADVNGYQVSHNYTFGVCATDTISRTETTPCRQTSITVLPLSVTVTMAGTGSGTVAPSRAGNSCGANCYSGFASGSSVTLTATPATGSTFTGWSGAGCSGTGSCVVPMNTSQAVTATFGQGVTGTWSGSFVWPGANYPGCPSQTISVTTDLVQNGNNVTGSFGNDSGTISGDTMIMTGNSTIFGVGTPQTWTWDGANTIQAVVGYGCYDLGTLAILSHGYYSVVLTRN